MNNSWLISLSNLRDQKLTDPEASGDNSRRYLLKKSFAIRFRSMRIASTSQLLSVESKITHVLFFGGYCLEAQLTRGKVKPILAIGHSGGQCRILSEEEPIQQERYYRLPLANKQISRTLCIVDLSLFNTARSIV